MLEGHLGGLVGKASPFGSGGDPGVPGIEPCIGVIRVVVRNPILSPNSMPFNFCTS